MEKEKQYITKKLSLFLVEEEGSERMKVVMFTNNVDDDKINASIKGMHTRDKDNSVPFIDAHMQYGSIVKVMLGRVYDVHDGEHEGREAKIGYIEFAKTEVGREAEILYRSGIARDVSVGLWFYERDIDATGFVMESEIVELSGVVVGADKLAKAIQSAKMAKPDIEKLVQNFNDIKPKVKLYRELFMDEQLFDTLGIAKTGEEEEDARNLKAALQHSLTAKASADIEDEKPEDIEDKTDTENQSGKAENQQSFLTQAEAKQLFNQLFD